MKVEKMHGCGNDFCLIDYKENTDYEKLALKLCNRKTGVGSDGLIVVKRDPLEMLFYNADGSRALMCGNGIRCFALYAYEHKMVNKLKFPVVTGAGQLELEIVNPQNFTCKVYMGKPIFTNQMIYVNDDIDSFGRVIKINDSLITIYSFFMGTIHTVIFVNDFTDNVVEYASKICNNPLFTKKTNVNFVRVINKENIEVKTYERGVGWTLACGTGCCASVVAANRLGLVGTKVKAILELGFLEIELKKNDVFMTGPATKVFECEIKEEI